MPYSALYFSILKFQVTFYHILNHVVFLSIFMIASTPLLDWSSSAARLASLWRQWL